MKINAIISEYNPFHNGHAFHLKDAKNSTGADFSIVIMSGNFVQRGEPAITDKYIRAKEALKNGADLVLELSPLISSASAGYFAEGAVVNLSKLGVVDTLCFGAESDDPTGFKNTAKILSAEEHKLKTAIQENLKNGQSFALARQNALCDIYGAEQGLLSDPNNILALEYETAILKHKIGFDTYITKRNDPGYNSCETLGNIASALAIRSLIKENKTIEITKLLPADFDKTILKYPVFKDDYSEFLHYKLLNESLYGFEKYLDVSKDMSERIRIMIPEYRNCTDFCDLLKSKNVAYSTISRGLLHIFTGLLQERVESYKESGYGKYIKVLGFKKSAAPLLKNISNNAVVPLIVNKNDYDKYIYKDEKLKFLYHEEMRIESNYDLILHRKYSKNIISDLSKEAVIM
ncbi:MAG: nucleotidyltransferase family protein [Acetatifactor sp.]|nr:nucleotidyltransferase family protein [Acetatifactor sp.]